MSEIFVNLTEHLSIPNTEIGHKEVWFINNNLLHFTNNHLIVFTGYS